MLEFLNSGRLLEIDSYYHSAPSSWNFSESFYQPTKKILAEIEPHLKSSWSLSYDEITVRQFQRIQQIVKHAYEHVPFYHRLYSEIDFHPNDLKNWDDFELLPIITKTDFLNNKLVNFISDEHPLAIKEAQEGKDPCSQPLILLTSGSSGIKTAFSVSPSLTLIDTMLAYRQMMFQSQEKYCHLKEYALHIEAGQWWIEIDDYKRVLLSTMYNTLNNPEFFTVDKVDRLLQNSKISFLSLYPSILEKILSVLDLSQYNLKLVTVHSEKTTCQQREDYSRQINAPVLDEYSSQELTRIALESPDTHEYIIEEDTNYIESVDSRIIGTSLINQSTPFIRYDQGDIAEIKRRDNLNFRVLKNFRGRENDSLVLPNGEKVYSGELLDQTYKWRETINFRSYTIVQYQDYSIVLYIDSKNTLTHKEKEYIYRTFQNLTLLSTPIKIVERPFEFKNQHKRSTIIRYGIT